MASRIVRAKGDGHRRAGGLTTAALLLGTTLAAGSPEDASGAAEESRAAEWARRRREQAERLEPYRPAWLEKQILAVEKAERPRLLDWNLWGLYPRVHGIAAGSRTAAGIRFWQPNIGGSPASVHASAYRSWVGYQFYEVQAGRIPHREGALPLRSVRGDDLQELGQLGRSGLSPLILYASARHEDYTQLEFFGLGPETQPADRTSYRLRQTGLDLVVGYQPGRHLGFRLYGGPLHSRVGAGTRKDVPTLAERFDDAAAPGLASTPRHVHISAQAFLDLRDEPGNPQRGGMLAVQGSRFVDRGGDAYRFDRISADARGYLSLGSPQRVLALRALAARARPASGARVPFYLQEYLGGSHTLRGYPHFRFRGTDLLLFQAEYRWEPAPALELLLFYDAGLVGDDSTPLRLGGLKTDWGFGLRLKTHRVVLARLDLARSSEDTRILLRFSPSF